MNIENSSQLGPVEYLPEIWTVPKDSIYAAIHAVGKGLEYARQALREHDRDIGRATYKYRIWAEVIERDIEQMKKTLENLKSLS